MRGERGRGAGATRGEARSRGGRHGRSSRERRRRRERGVCTGGDCSRACGEEKLGRQTMFSTIGSRDGRLVSTEVAAGPMGGIGPISHFGLEWSRLCPRLFFFSYFLLLVEMY